MCGFFGHGFYEPETKEVIFDFEINSHGKIKEIAEYLKIKMVLGLLMVKHFLMMVVKHFGLIEIAM